jgi:hydroxymethylpyrimidine pyrophosphatase-like HAD family hydrolase
MRYVAVAAGFDGTLAKDGRCDPRCVAALRKLSSSGRKLILVTARELRELLEIFPEARIFDYVIAENGAVMHRPAERVSSILAEAPSETLLRELRMRGVAPLAVGSSIIKTSRENEPLVAEALHRLRLDHQLIANDSTLIVLPAHVDKASGVAAALRELELSAHNLIAIGDAPNDLALFALAEHSVAVQNAHPSLRAVAGWVAQGEYCDGFLEIAHRILSEDVSDAVPRHRLLLGRDAAGNDVILHPFQDSLLILGPVGSGKRAVCRSLLDRLNALDYQCCVIAAEVSEGSSLSRGLVSCGSPHEVPRLNDVMGVIEQPDVGVFVNVAGLSVDARAAFTEALLLQLQALHDRAGRPHVILILDAHAQFPLGGVPQATGRLSEITLIYTTTAAQMVPSNVLAAFKKVIRIGEPSLLLDDGFVSANATPLILEDVPGVPAVLLLRAAAETSSSHATIGGRAPVAPSASVEVTESAVSGY